MRSKPEYGITPYDTTRRAHLTNQNQPDTSLPVMHDTARFNERSAAQTYGPAVFEPPQR